MANQIRKFFTIFIKNIRKTFIFYFIETKTLQLSSIDKK